MNSNVLPTEQDLIEIGIDHEWCVMFLKIEDSGITIDHLVFYGEYPDENNMKHLIEELNTDPEFSLVGKVHEYEVKILTKHQYFDFVRLVEPV